MTSQRLQLSLFLVMSIELRYISLLDEKGVRIKQTQEQIFPLNKSKNKRQATNLIK